MRRLIEKQDNEIILDTIEELTYYVDEDGNNVPTYFNASELVDNFGLSIKEATDIAKNNGYNAFRVKIGDNNVVTFISAPEIKYKDIMNDINSLEANMRDVEDLTDGSFNITPSVEEELDNIYEDEENEALLKGAGDKQAQKEEQVKNIVRELAKKDFKANTPLGYDEYVDFEVECNKKGIEATKELFDLYLEYLGNLVQGNLYAREGLNEAEELTPEIIDTKIQSIIGKQIPEVEERINKYKQDQASTKDEKRKHTLDNKISDAEKQIRDLNSRIEKLKTRKQELIYDRNKEAMQSAEEKVSKIINPGKGRAVKPQDFKLTKEEKEAYKDFTEFLKDKVTSINIETSPKTVEVLRRCLPELKDNQYLVRRGTTSGGYPMKFGVSAILHTKDIDECPPAYRNFFNSDGTISEVAKVFALLRASYDVLGDKIVTHEEGEVKPRVRKAKQEPEEEPEVEQERKPAWLVVGYDIDGRPQEAMPCDTEQEAEELAKKLNDEQRATYGPIEQLPDAYEYFAEPNDGSIPAYLYEAKNEGLEDDADKLHKEMKKNYVMSSKILLKVEDTNGKQIEEKIFRSRPEMDNYIDEKYGLRFVDLTGQGGQVTTYKGKTFGGTIWVLKVKPEENENLNEKLDDYETLQMQLEQELKNAKRRGASPKELRDIQREYREKMNSLEEDIEKHEELNPKLFDGEELKPDVKEAIQKIADTFVGELNEDGIRFTLKDIVLLGSNVSYNYTKDSDLDIHLIADSSGLECPDNLYPLLYSAYRSMFNKNYDVKIKGIPAEIYVEMDEPQARSNGIYSLNSGWLKKPIQQDIPDLDKEAFDKLFKEWEEKYKKIVGE